MSEETEWENPAKEVKPPDKAGLSDEDLSKLSEFQVRMYSELTQEVLESMLVGYFINDPDISDKINARDSADIIYESGLTGANFENESFGILFDDMMKHYKSSRTILTLDEAEQKCIALGQTHNRAMMYKMALARCHASIVARRIDANILVRRMLNHHRSKKADDIIKEYLDSRTDPTVGPENSLEVFRHRVARDLIDTKSGVLKEYDWIDHTDRDVAWMMDMKQNPDKYKGYMCGIPAIDTMTEGFRPGQLTIFVGKHGGYKSTVMLNVAYGLWERGYNVLYASLEMEAQLIKAKLWCRGTQKLQWSKVYRGFISHPDDWKRIEELRAMLPALEGKQKEDAVKEISRLDECISTTTTQGKVYLKQSDADTLAIAEFRQRQLDKPNRLKIINVGQSEKIKPSQIERYIEDGLEDFKPNVVIVDYLALVDSETSYQDRRDLEVGDVCKRFRAMGLRLNFHTISAAQYKRAAIERIRKYGFNNPDKAQFNTDDIAESNQIGADADNVFMLWPLDGGNELQLSGPKARHAMVVSEGIKIPIIHEHCYIGGNNIKGTTEITKGISLNKGFDLARGGLLGPAIPAGEMGEDVDNVNLIPYEPTDKEF